MMQAITYDGERKKTILKDKEKWEDIYYGKNVKK